MHLPHLVRVPFLLACGLLATSAGVQAQAPVSAHDHAAANVFGQMPWRELGPVASGGRIVDLAVHPQRPQVFWAAAASGGLWKTTNGGISFVPQFQQEYLISIGDIAVAESNGDVLYVGTGEANNQRSSYWGDGVYRSNDGGASFQHLGLEGTDHIGRIAVHPRDPDVVYVAALGALYRSSDTRGLYRSRDGGITWQRVLHRGPDIGFVDVVLDPQDPTIVYAASYERRRGAWHLQEGGEGSRLWQSVDAGDTWRQLENGLPGGTLGRIGLDVFRRDGKVVYATIENLNPATAPATAVPPPVGDPPPVDAPAEILADPLAAAQWQAKVEAAQDPVRRSRKKIQGGEVYRSLDGGSSWQKTHGSDVEVGGSPGYYYGQIRIDPQQRDTVYVLSVPVHKSTDGGATWTPRRGESGSFARTLHVDHHALWIDPQDSEHCLLGNDGGLAVTWDGGQTWDHLAHLPVLQFYTVAADLRTPYRVYGGLQDNGTVGFPIHGRSTAGILAMDASRIDGGDGFHVCIDPNDPDVVYSESQFGGMSRQNLRTGERHGIKPKARKGDQALRFNWNTPIVLSPHAPHTVYTGSQHLHRSRDRGTTWHTVSPDLSTNDPAKTRGNVPHCTITTIAESPRSEGWLWVGTDDGKVWTSRDAGLQWDDLTPRFPAEVQGLWVSRVETSPHAAETAFVSFTGYREDLRLPFVFRTDDGGLTWRAIAHDLPWEAVNVVRQHPRQPNVLLVGTEMGAYVSLDDGAHWFALGRGLPRVAVHDLIVHARESHVLVGTHGRGIWALDAAALEGLQPGDLERAFHVLPPSDGVLLPRAFSRGNTGARSWSAENPFVTPTFRYLLAEDSQQPVQLEVIEATGKVLWAQEGPQLAGYHEVVWQQRGGRGAGPGGGGGRQPGARAPTGPRPGEFAVRITRGDQARTLPFSVVDRRGPGSSLGSVLGAVPGFGGDSAADDTEDTNTRTGFR